MIEKPGQYERHVYRWVYRHCFSSVQFASVNICCVRCVQFIPGTKKMFPGLKKPQERADVIAYLKKSTAD